MNDQTLKTQLDQRLCLWMHRKGIRTNHMSPDQRIQLVERTLWLVTEQTQEAQNREGR